MKLRQKLAQFMYGRRGMDEFAWFLLVAVLALALISGFMPGLLRTLFSLLELAALVYCYIRVFSRDIYKRQRENAWYLQRRNAVVNWFRSLRDRWLQRKDYRFFRCPSCRALLRVPKNKGKLLLTCRKCGNRFERKT